MANQKPEELSKIDYQPAKTEWMETPTVFKKGIFCYGNKPKSLEAVSLPNPRPWSVTDEDWKLPENWQEIFIEGLRERVSKYRSFRLFLERQDDIPGDLLYLELCSFEQHTATRSQALASFKQPDRRLELALFLLQRGYDFLQLSQSFFVG